MSRARDRVDAVVIGSGPNGLVAAITLARKGWDVLVLERNASAGGAVASVERAGYVFDPYSAFYGVLFSTPVFRDLGLGERLPWAHFDIPVGALLDPRAGAFLHADPDRTARALGADGDAWRGLWEWWDRMGRRFAQTMMAPIPPIRTGLGFARRARIRGGIDTTKMMLAPVTAVAEERFTSAAARALFACGASHSDLSVQTPGSTPATTILAMVAQEHGMPVPVGGAGTLAATLVSLLEEHGGAVRTGDEVTRVLVDRGRAIGVETASGAAVLARHAVIADTSAVKLARDLVGEEHLPPRFFEGIRRYRYGTGMFKVDIGLGGEPEWTHPDARRCGVVHLCGDLSDMARAAHEAQHGLLPARPMLIVGQQSVADPTRAPAGSRTLWVETHVPPHPRGDGANGRSFDGWDQAREVFLERVLDMIDTHAPGTRERIAHLEVRTPADLENENPNLVDGDVGGGSFSIDQQLVFRPVAGWFRYRMPLRGLYLCSASAHPGGGVHGMVGRHCARRVIKDARGLRGLVATAAGARRRPRST